MISILIPVYNYDITSLVSEIYEQLILCKVDFEIICVDDCSTVYSSKNASITKLEHTHYYKSDKNHGRSATRQHLAKKAKYDWLLFLDADVMPKSKNFISRYINKNNFIFDAIYGGFAYHKSPPGPKQTLRWKYGVNNEEVPALKRNKKPFKVIISANFMIKKRVFLMINSMIKDSSYGQDNYFGALLKKHKINVHHIDNEVYHLGIEKNADYLQKKEIAAKSLLCIYQSNKIKAHENTLLAFFETLKKTHLLFLFSLIYKHFGVIIKSNLLGKNPNIKILQLYRISFMSYQYFNTSK